MFWVPLILKYIYFCGQGILITSACRRFFGHLTDHPVYHRSSPHLSQFGRGLTLSATNMRVVGIVFLGAAAVLFILNLKRVANLGTYFVALPLFLFGIILVARSRKS